MVFVGPAEMQLADRYHAVAALAQQVMPGGHRAVVGVGIVPEADLVDVLADGEARARRNAYRAGGIRVGEYRAARSERVKARRMDDRMPSVPGDFRVVFIGHDDQEIQCAHRLSMRVVILRDSPLLQAFARSSARSRLCLRVRTSRQRSPMPARRSGTFVILKSRGCAFASSSQVSGIDTGAPAAPLGE